MDIRERQQDGLTILALTGRLTVNDQPGLLKTAVATSVDRGVRCVVLDLSDVKYIDSTRLGELIASHVTLSRQGGRLCLAATPARVAELLAMAGLDGIFDRYDTVADAVASAKPLG
jgi:anti-sigma B factor antagonist